MAAALALSVVKLENLSQVTTGVTTVASVAYFVVMRRSPKVEPVERTRVRAFIPLFVANAAFWSLFQQVFNVPAVYFDERMNWSIFGWTAPSSWTGSIEPAWVVGARLPSGYHDPAKEFAYFGVLGLIAIAVGTVVFVLSGWIRKLMEGLH